MRLLVSAPAKLNLGLEVLRRRDDGYHELRSLMVSIDLRDLVTLRPGDGALRTAGPFAGDAAPGDPANLVTRALAALGAGAWRAHIYKRIPAGAGLGGGSADAAAVLRVAPGLGVDIDAGRLARLAFQLGADVPFQLVGGAALVSGAGEEVEPLRLSPTWAAVAWPGFHVSTAAVFAELRPGEMSDGARVSAAAARVRAGGMLDPAEELPNALWAPAVRRYPALGDAADALRKAGWRPRLTGTGSALFQLCSTPSEARRLAGAAPREMVTWAVETVPAADLVTTA